MATAPVKKAAATPVDVAAYRLDRTSNQGGQPVALYYVLERDAEVILNTPAEDLVFVDPAATKNDVDATFGLHHPPSHPALTNLTSESSHHRSSLPFKYCIRTQREWYAGLDVQVVCEAAEALGTPVRTAGPTYWQGKRHLLYEHGCYLRTSGEGSFIVYNPKIAARGLKRGNVSPVTPYVTCAEFMAWSRAMQSLNIADGLTDIVGADNLWEWRRRPVMHRLRRDLALFELLYGRGAYWQLEEFCNLIETWKKKGPATWASFQRTLSYSYQLIFVLLDEEVDRKRKPRKRELKLRLPRGYRWK